MTITTNHKAPIQFDPFLNETIAHTHSRTFLPVSPVASVLPRQSHEVCSEDAPADAVADGAVDGADDGAASGGFGAVVGTCTTTLPPSPYPPPQSPKSLPSSKHRTMSPGRIQASNLTSKLLPPSPPRPSTPPSPLHPPLPRNRHRSPIPSSTCLPPLISNPQRTTLPPPTNLPRPSLPRPVREIPPSKPLYQSLLTDPPPPPFPSNPADGDLVTQSTQCRVCQHPAMKTCSCTLIPLCRVCIPPEGHAAFCARHRTLVKLVKRREDHPSRLELVTILRGLFKHDNFLPALQLAVWHAMEILRISGWRVDQRRRRVNQRVSTIARDVPCDLCRLGEGDVALALVHSLNTQRTPEKQLTRFSDALPRRTSEMTPVEHLIALCLVKARVLGSYYARRRDGRRLAFWDSSMGKTLSQDAGQRLDDFLIRAGRRDDFDVQKGLFDKYANELEARNSMLGGLVRGSWKAHRGHGPEFDAAKRVWDEFGDMFLQIPCFPACVL